MIRLLAPLFLILIASPALAQDGLPALNLTGGDGETTYSLSLQILILMTVLTVLP